MMHVMKIAPELHLKRCGGAHLLVSASLIIRKELIGPKNTFFLIVPTLLIHTYIVISMRRCSTFTEQLSVITLKLLAPHLHLAYT
jgi:hypothetical protein